VTDHKIHSVFWTTRYGLLLTKSLGRLTIAASATTVFGVVLLFRYFSELAVAKLSIEKSPRSEKYTPTRC
jgi:hypothetical protein